MFSKRLPPHREANPIARERARIGRIPYDLTISNPTLCGIPYPQDLLSALASPAGLIYLPDPFGVESARRAVAEDYRRHGVDLDPGRVVLTASSSESYGFLFKLLCDPGDEVLVPTPSYPLFAHLAALDAVRVIPYRLSASAGWHPSIEPGSGPNARAVLAVHPNNPTGSLVDGDAYASLIGACRSRGAALVVDEVFLDYPLGHMPPPSTHATRSDVLTFTLGGLSKSLGLPQLKLSWVVVSGPQDEVAEALERLEIIADSYLSVSTPVQLALPALFRDAIPVRSAILERCNRNLETLRAACRAAPSVSLVEPRGGFTAVLRYPAVLTDESLALELLARDGVAVHPGYFYDFEQDGCLVLSLLPEEDGFAEGTTRLFRRIEGSISRP